MTLDVAQFESVIDAAAPFGDGFLRIRDVAGGALLEVDLNGGGDGYVALAVFEGGSAAALGSEFVLV